jgi:hypothetical protein
MPPGDKGSGNSSHQPRKDCYESARSLNAQRRLQVNDSTERLEARDRADNNYDVSEQNTREASQDFE